MILSLKIALRFHRSFKRNVLMSLVSFIAIIIITVGIVISVIALSIINGFEYELRKRILSIIPHGEIISTNSSFINWKIILSRLRKIPDIISLNPYICFTGIIEYRNKWHLIYVKSIDLIENTNLYNNVLINFIEENVWKKFHSSTYQIILGEGVARALNIKNDDWITILLTNNFNSNNKLLSIKKINVQVSGILKLNSHMDNNLAIISLSDAFSYCNSKLNVDGIEFSIDNAFHIDQIIKKIKCNVFSDDNVKVYSWTDVYGYMYRDIQIIRIIIYLSVIFIIGISFVSVLTVLILSIKNKNYDIAILKSLGARNILIQNIFLWYGLCIYCVSGILGTSLGICIVLNFKYISTEIMKFLVGKNIVYIKEVYFIDFIPIIFKKTDFYMLLGLILLGGLVVSWYVILKTNNIDLSKILK